MLAELHDVYVVPVLRADGLHEMRMNQEVGRRYPAHAGATGKVLVAHLPEGERRALVDRLELEALTGATVTDRGALDRRARARSPRSASRSPSASGSPTRSRSPRRCSTPMGGPPRR